MMIVMSVSLASLSTPSSGGLPTILLSYLTYTCNKQIITNWVSVWPKETLSGNHWLLDKGQPVDVLV